MSVIFSLRLCAFLDQTYYEKRSIEDYTLIFLNFAGADGWFQQSLFKIVSKKVLNLSVNYIQYAIFETCLDKVLDRYLRDFRVVPG